MRVILAVIILSGLSLSFAQWFGAHLASAQILIPQDPEPSPPAVRGFTVRPPAEAKEAGAFGEFRVVLGISLVYILFAVIVWGASKAILKQAKDLKIYADRLEESLKREKALSAAKDQFITVASHQLNTPLSVVGWSAEIIQNPSSGKEEVEAAVKGIAAAEKELAAIVSDILAVAEIGFSYEKKNVEHLDLAVLINEALGRFASAAREKKLVVHTEVRAQNSSVYGDAIALRRVLEDLIENAIEYSNEAGRVRISIREDPQSLIWEIADEGIGIPPDERQKLFEQFFRATNAIEKKNVGTGLGLFIAKTIIEGHGGSIAYRPGEEKGSIFTVKLPK